MLSKELWSKIFSDYLTFKNILSLRLVSHHFKNSVAQVFKSVSNPFLFQEQNQLTQRQMARLTKLFFDQAPGLQQYTPHSISDPNLQVFTNLVVAKAQYVDISSKTGWECYDSEFNEVKFSLCTLEGSHFSSIVWNACAFTGSLSQSYFVNTQINNGNFQTTSFGNTKMFNGHFVNVIMNNCSFKNSTLRNCYFQDIPLWMSEWDSAILHNVEFMRCDFNGVDLSNCLLSNVKFTECINYHGANHYPIDIAAIKETSIAQDFIASPDFDDCTDEAIVMSLLELTDLFINKNNTVNTVLFERFTNQTKQFDLTKQVKCRFYLTQAISSIRLGEFSRVITYLQSAINLDRTITSVGVPQCIAELVSQQSDSNHQEIDDILFTMNSMAYELEELPSAHETTINDMSMKRIQDDTAREISVPDISATKHPRTLSFDCDSFMHNEHLVNLDDYVEELRTHSSLAPNNPPDEDMFVGSDQMDIDSASVDSQLFLEEQHLESTVHPSARVPFNQGITFFTSPSGQNIVVQRKEGHAKKVSNPSSTGQNASDEQVTWSDLADMLDF